jgi:hypothetical protein
MKFPLIVALIALAAAEAAAQTTRLVPSQYPTIQTAIAASISGDTILVAPGIYSGAINYLGKNVAVASTGGAAVTTLTATGGRVVTFATNESAAASLTGFTITGMAGGMRIQGASPQIADCRFLNCFVGGYGGGVFVTVLTNVPGSTAAPTFYNCDFVGGIAQNVLLGTSGSSSTYSGSGGGGLSARETPPPYGVSQSGIQTLAPSLVDCRFLGNYVVDSYPYGGGFGGGLEVSASSTTQLSASCIRCRFEDNVCTSGGGAYVAGSGSAALIGCRFGGNVAQSTGSGGGLSAGGALSLTVSGCEFVENAAGGNGGGMTIGTTATALVVNCTVAGNSAPILGGGVSAAAVNIVNSIVWGNSGLDIWSQIGASGVPTAAPTFSLVGTGLYAASPTNLSADPRFVDPANGDFHLAPNSPCKDAGNGSVALPAFDIDGGPRVVGAAPDMGADEIPVLGMPGTGDDLELFAWKNGGGDPLATSTGGAAFDVLRLLLRSPGGSFVGVPPLVVGEIFPVGSPPPSTPGVPLYVSLNVFVIYGTTGAGPLTAPGLTPDGVELFLQAPPGLSGLTFRAQAAAIGGPASNNAFALTRATDVVF